MATFKPTIIKANAFTKGVFTGKKDGTINCVIRITHNRKSRYIKTAIYISKAQLTKSGDIKDPTVLDALNKIAKGYRDKLVSIADRVEMYDIDSLVEYLTRKNDDIDFMEYYKVYLTQIPNPRTKEVYTSVYNTLVSFYGPKLPISKLNAAFLKSFERYLLSSRTHIRTTTSGVEIKRPVAKLTNQSIFHYMSLIKTVFNAARLEYNNEDTGDIRIPFYPFRSYKMPTPEAGKKRNLPPDQIRMIRDTGTLAADIFMISFYACGMNMIDLYYADTIRDGRLEYNRTKTKGKRKDNAFISIRIEPELAVLIEKYKDPTGVRVLNFHKRYRTFVLLTRAANEGLGKIIPNLTTYYARHSWATIARNDCGVAKDVVSEALNHSSGISVTDIYLARDWSAIDRANRAVIDLINP